MHISVVEFRDLTTASKGNPYNWPCDDPERFLDVADDMSSADVLADGGEMGALMRSIDWSKTPLGSGRRLVAGAADDGRSAAAQPVPDAALVGARVRSALQRRVPADPRRQAPEVDGPARRGMLGRDLAHHRADGRGAVSRRAGDLERRPRPADRPQGVPRGDPLQGVLQPGPRRDRAADRHRRRARDRGRDDGGRVRRAPAADAARAGRERGRRADARAGVREGGGDAGRQPARRAVRRLLSAG